MEPINLKDLPDRLKKLREKKEFDENLVVDMGKISPPPFFTGTRVALTFLLLFLVSFVSISTFDLIRNKNVTIVLNTNDIDPETLSDILSENGAKIISVKETGGSSYEVELSRLGNLKEFIEKLRKNKSLKDIEIKQ